MRHRIKAGKVGSFKPQEQKEVMELQENKKVAEEVDEIFEDETDFCTEDEALAAMEFYESPEEIE